MAFALGMDDGTLRYQGRLCVPNMDGLRERIIAEAHSSRYSMNPCYTKMYHDLKKVYWWNDMKRNVSEFVARCQNFQQVKADNQRLGGLAQNKEIPMWKWKLIHMDFVIKDARILEQCSELKKAQSEVCWLNSFFSSAHLEEYQRTLATEVHQMATLGVRLADSSEGGIIVQNRVESSIIVEVKEKQYNDPLLVQLTEGIHKHKTMAFSLSMDDGTLSWDDDVPLIEFFCNSSYHASIQMALFEDLYGRKCRSPIGWFEIGEVKLIGPDRMHQAMDKVNIIKEQLKTTQRCEKSYSDMHRRDLEFKEDDWVVLKVSPMKGIMRFGKKVKLSPRYVIPYKII
ncbi:uncharacterized protein [Nicotiana sylvestris]|uniref:uncharacterized protein n=1 Tax=Nicotiana sylvestris TaxID=4096 RepID=UPI00388CC301